MTWPARHILGMRVDACSYASAVDQIVGWAREGGSRAVYVATVNNVMEGVDDPSYRASMEAGDLVTPDGMPLVWGLRLLGVAAATRVYGPDLMPSVCARADRDAIPIGLYGGTPEVLDALLATLRSRFPRLEIAYAEAPPFRPLTAEEDDAVVEAINASGAQILFVGLGAPKQERWIDAHRDDVDVVMIGVGAAFDFLAGRKRQAPRWMQRAGLEWLFRLAHEPLRLWRRYVVRNPRFVWLFMRQLLGSDGRK